ncbi:MAG: ATP-binding cassette domain-containing protein [Deltaproteobacteria bacterium]|jgi:tungstate transport system ATP-binding protein|nr:ATP-binding cassette domain-containing protein [Deltaproteobacteria bacterium]
MLEAHNLQLILSDKEIFKLEHLVLRKGEVLALVGPNGAGKSSLLLTLALLQRPTAGTIRIDGVHAGNGNLLAMRRRMALVFQDALLLDTTVTRNITIPLRIRGLSRKEAIHRCERWLDRFGVAHLAKRPARILSGGEAQRTSLARAFAMEPELLFLDEPFAALDYPTRKLLLGELGSILQEMNMTTLFVTHDYTEIPYLARQVAVLFEGRIIKYGSIREVFGDEILDRRVWVPWERD